MIKSFLFSPFTLLLLMKTFSICKNFTIDCYQKQFLSYRHFILFCNHADVAFSTHIERQQILKRAEDEAQADIDAYRAERQKHYDDKLKQVCWNNLSRFFGCLRVLLRFCDSFCSLPCTYSTRAIQANVQRNCQQLLTKKKQM